MNSVHAIARSRIDEALRTFVPQANSNLDLRIQRALHVARYLQQRAADLQTPHERKQQMELDRMIQNPHDKTTLMQMTDQAFRSQAPHRAVDQLVHILDVQGVPRFFNPFDRTLLRGFQSFGSYLPGVAVPLVKEKMRHETANVILPAEREMLGRHLRARRSEGLRMNVNYLGEALLGEQQARARLNSYLESLQVPEIEVISVKISTIYSQISSLAREHTVNTLCDRLELLFRAAAKQQFVRADGSICPKFVYLDMEEYRDMRLTADAFMQTLDRPGLQKIEAGLALQAYLPDSYQVQLDITEWARKRVAGGGAPVTIRIVKGANMEMERVEASLNDWPQALFQQKIETDANYKRMLQAAFEPENIRAVRIGVATHNLFEVAYALVLAHEKGVLDDAQFEMLEGMANHQRRALLEMDSNVLLYAPACRKEEFINAIGYLIRRLDENTGEDNFLRHAFKLRVDSPEWERLQQKFVDSFQWIGRIGDQPRRKQDRSEPTPRPQLPESWTEFRNEPNTDFALPQNGEWAEQVVAQWQSRAGDNAMHIPLVVCGKVIQEAPAASIAKSFDPSRPETVVGRFIQATEQQINEAIQCAADDPSGWRSGSYRDRLKTLSDVAQQIRVSRADLIGAAIADGGKTFWEADPEVSEAIDFVEFYARAAEDFSKLPRAIGRGKGVVVVVSPWNFPIAIPCGGIAAALAAGNTVILKPSSDAVLTAYLICDCFWRGGVPREALQFAPCPGSTAGKTLVSSDAVAAIILTGGTSTAQAMLKQRPACPLFAETGGKNGTIVTALADRDQAIKNILQSAFSHSGQKCSATSLLLLEDEIYEDHSFREALCDAAASLPVGSAWDLRTKVGPLIRPPRDELERGLKELEPGESWALMPEHKDENLQLYSPGIKWGVQPGSFTHTTELFGPVLGVMRFRSLAEAISLVNQTGYGLTSGLESLDDREQEIWKRAVRAGNLYINRATTGAIVLRQPFGGMGKSAFGAGIKAGGPNYVIQLMDYQSRADNSTKFAKNLISDPLLQLLANQIQQMQQMPASASLPAADIAHLLANIMSYDAAARDEFLQSHDHFRLLGQDNLRRYLPIAEIRIRAVPADESWDILARVCAARAVGCRITVSYDDDAAMPIIELIDRLTEDWAGQIEFVEESDEQLAAAVRDGDTHRVRYAAPDRVPLVVREAAADVAQYIADAPVCDEGRVELLWYIEEQSISSNYHRYGNLGDRGSEPRREPE